MEPSLRRVPALVERGLPLVAVAAAAAAYAWLPRVYFFSDDFLHLYDVVNLPLPAWLLQPHGGHLYVIRNLIFALTHALAGARPEWFMATALAVHLLNTWLLVRVLRRFTAIPLLACLGAVVWGTSPDLEATLPWYSVFGQVLATTVLLVVVGWAGAYEDRTPSRRTVLAWVMLIVAGATCFGSGIGFALVSPLVLVLLVPALSAHRRLLLAAPLSAIVLYLALPALHAWVDPTRSEPSIAGIVLEGIWTTWPIVRLPAMFAALVGRGVVGLAGTRASVPAGWELPALALWVAACAFTLWRGNGVERRRLSAFVVVTLAAYAVVVGGRGFNDLVTLEPRYHYYASVPLLVTICLVVARGRAGFRLRRPGFELPIAFTAALLILVARGSLLPPKMWTLPIRRVMTTRFDAAVRRLALQTPAGSTLYLENAPLVVSPIPFTPVRFPGYAALFCVLHPDGTIAGRPVRFVDPDPEALRGAAGGRCSGEVVVAAAPPGVTVQPAPAQDIGPRR